jgi:hypothetical protein
MRSSSTSFPRASERVHGVAEVTGVLLPQRERGGVNGVGRATSCQCASGALAVHALAWHGTPGRVWAPRVLGRVGFFLARERVQRDQYDQGKVKDMLMQG